MFFSTILADTVPMVPTAGALPGGTVAQDFADGIGFYALLFCVVGLVLSGGMWAVGAFSNNYTQSTNGKKGFLICAGAALAIGSAAYIVQYFNNAGNSVKASSYNGSASLTAQ